MTWTPVTSQSESWTSLAPEPRTFSPLTFSRRPVFDTGPSVGIWDESTRQAETWAI